MIVGYINQEEQIFCADCWRSQAEAGARPAQVLDSDDPHDPSANFWIVDNCADCGGQVKYQDATTLN
jgi:hypothetical protein